MSGGTTNGNGFIPRYGMIISTVTVAIIVVGGFWGAVINPITTRMEKLENNHLTVREHEEFKLRIDKDLTRLNDHMSRGEVNERMLSLASRIADQQRQIDDIRKAYAEIFPSTKVIDQLFNRIDKLESSKVSK